MSKYVGGCTTLVIKCICPIALCAHCLTIYIRLVISIQINIPMFLFNYSKLFKFKMY
jgi:hypothetical protein